MKHSGFFFVVSRIRDHCMKLPLVWGEPDYHIFIVY